MDEWRPGSAVGDSDLVIDRGQLRRGSSWAASSKRRCGAHVCDSPESGQLAPLRRGEEPGRVRTKSRASVREVPLLDRAYEAFVAQLRDEQAKGMGNESDCVFTSLTGRPLGRDRLSKRGVLGSGDEGRPRACHRPDASPFAGNGDGYARVPVVVAAARHDEWLREVVVRVRRGEAARATEREQPAVPPGRTR